MQGARRSPDILPRAVAAPRRQGKRGGPVQEAKRRAGRPLTAASLERAALDYLERFASSAADLRRVLLRRVKRAAERDGSDARAGAALVEAVVARLHRRGASRRMIAGQLARHGIDRDRVAAALAGLAPAGVGDPDLAAACALARRRRLGPYRAPEERASRRDKDLAALARHGFSLEIARRVLACADSAELEALARGEA